MPTITKIQTTTYYITHVVLDMMTFNELYRNIRKNHKYKGFSCFNCDKDFQNEEKISVIFTEKGNKTVCRECGEIFMNELYIEKEGKT